MNVRRLTLLAGPGAVALFICRGLMVRGIRAIDQRGGLATRRGERAYGSVAPLFAGLHRHVVDDVVSIVGNRPAVVIDIGAGPGDVLFALTWRAPVAVLTGVEPSRKMRELAASRGVAEVDGSAETLPLEDGSVDLAVSTLSLHHWDRPAQAFAEIRRVLRPGGQARLYDVRFATYTEAEVRQFAHDAGLGAATVRRSVLEEHVLGVRPYVLITLDA